MLAEEEEQIIHRVRCLLNLRVSNAKDPGGGSRKQLNPQGGNNQSLDNAGKADRWRKLFLSYDKDKSGTITFKELRSLIRTCLKLSEAACTDNELKVVFARLDEDGSGAIEFDEFCTFVQAVKQNAKEVPSSVGRALRLAMSREKIRSEHDLRELFTKSDLDSDNLMSVYELSRFFREVLRLSQHEVSEFHIKKVHRLLDTDCSGQIAQGEFLTWITRNVDISSRGRHALVSATFGGSASPASTGGFGQPLGSTLPSLVPPGSAPGSERKSSAGGFVEGKRPQSTPWAPIPPPGGRRTYLSIPGAGRLNHVEQRLFEAGFDVRGEFFKVSEKEEGFSLSRNSLFRSTSGSSFPGPGKPSAGSLRLTRT